MTAPAPISTAPKKPWRKLPILGAALLVALIAIGLWPRAIPVESGTVARGALVVTVDEEGMTRVRNRYVVSAPVAGQLRRIDWKPGGPVEAGQTVLAVLESTGADFLDARSLAQAQAHVQAAEASRDAAIAQRDRAAAARKMAATELERAKQLRAQNVASAQELDLAEMRAETAAQEVRATEFAMKVAEFELQQARAILMRGSPGASGDAPKPLDPLVITSPVNGKILVGSSRVDLQACKLEYSIVSPK